MGDKIQINECLKNDGKGFATNKVSIECILNFESNRKKGVVFMYEYIMSLTELVDKIR